MSITSLSGESRKNEEYFVRGKWLLRVSSQLLPCGVNVGVTIAAGRSLTGGGAAAALLTDWKEMIANKESNRKMLLTVQQGLFVMVGFVSKSDKGF